MKGCAFGVGMAAGLVIGMVSYVMAEPCLPPRAKRAVRRGRRAVTRAVEHMM